MSYGYGRMGRPSYYGSAYEQEWSRGYAGFYGEPTLSIATRSSKESATRQLQNLLISKGFGALLGSTGADGDYGSNTAAAVRAYQSSAGLPVTGVADQATWNSLKGSSEEEDKGSGWDLVGNMITSFGTGAGLIKPTGGTSGSTTVGGALPGSGGSQGTAVVADEKKFPWGPVLGGTGVVAVIGFGIYFATRKKKK